jgi:hypothetical protein
LKKNNTGYLVGDRVSWPQLCGWKKDAANLILPINYNIYSQLTAADLAYYALFSDFIELKFGGAFLKDAPLLKSLLVRVRTSPNVKKWIDFRNSKYYPDGNE